MILKYIYLIIIFNIIIAKSLIAEDTIINFEDGSSYKGGVVDGVMEGRGVFLSSERTNNTILKYEGDFKDGKFHGTGTLEFNNGDLYNGGFALGLMHGKGTLKYQNGSIYEGLFLNGKKDG